MRRQKATAVLWHLRIYGPCSAARLIETTRLERTTVVWALRVLRDRGLAVRLRRGCYDVTEDGRAELERLFPGVPEELRRHIRQINQEEIKRMGLREPIADDPLTFREQDELFGLLGVLRDLGRRKLLDGEVENILRMAATLQHYRAWLSPEIDQALPDRVTLRGVCYLRTEL